MLRIITLVLACFTLAACAMSPQKFNNVSVGMNKAQVVKVLGSPYSSKARSGVEVLAYKVDEFTHVEEYWVVFEEGQVTQYGRAGELAPAVQQLNVNIKRQ